MTVSGSQPCEDAGVITRLKVCLNGGRGRDEHPDVPVTSAEVGAAALAAVAAGAEAVHLHPRAHDGKESLHPGDIASAVAAVRRSSPGVPVGVSTGLWIAGGDVGLRKVMVERWGRLPVSERPDFASVNVSEPGFADLVDTLHHAGIGVEAGVWSDADADALAAVGRADKVVRILVEVVGEPAERAVPTADQILNRLDERGVRPPRLLHGEEAACWPLITHAGRLELPTRIGLEDTLVGPDGTMVRDNAELVRLALAVWVRARQHA